MTEEDKKLLDRINEYAERKLNDPDKKMRVSSQLDRLKPIMLKIAEEQNTTVEDIFVRYMDLATSSNNAKFLNTVGNMTQNERGQDFTNLNI